MDKQFTPWFRLIADDTEVSKIIRDRLLELTFRDNAGWRTDTLSIKLCDRDWKAPILKQKTILKLYLGYKETSVSFMGKFTLDEVIATGSQAGDVLSYRAHAADFRSEMKEKRDWQWEDKTLKEIVETIAAKYGLGTWIDPDLAAHKIEAKAQKDESDLHFLKSLALHYDGTPKLANGEIWLLKRGRSRTPSVAKSPIITVQRNVETQRHRINLAGRKKYGRVRTHWMDKAAGIRRQVTVGSEGEIDIRRYEYTTEEEATLAAEFRLEAHQRGASTLTWTGGGDPKLLAESVIDLQGIRQGLPNQFHIDSVSHSFIKKAGYICSVDGSTPK